MIQYGRIKKHGVNGTTYIEKNELVNYYKHSVQNREKTWKKKLGQDLNWHLSFDSLREKDTTKHVHRFHPYKGKFIPQLVEYFLDGHTDQYKKQPFFQPGDIVLDPFCGSGTTLVQSNELGIHALGVDISAFNALISNVKVSKHHWLELAVEIKKIGDVLHENRIDSPITAFEKALSEELTPIFTAKNRP